MMGEDRGDPPDDWKGKNPSNYDVASQSYPTRQKKE